MKTVIAIYLLIALCVALIMAVCAYYQKKNRFCKIAVSVIYALTLVGLLFGMSVVEGKYGLKVLPSTVIAAVSLALVCVGEFLGNRLAKSKNTEE